MSFLNLFILTLASFFLCYRLEDALISIEHTQPRLCFQLWPFLPFQNRGAYLLPEDYTEHVKHQSHFDVREHMWYRAAPPGCPQWRRTATASAIISGMILFTVFITYFFRSIYSVLMPISFDLLHVKKHTKHNHLTIKCVLSVSKFTHGTVGVQLVV